MGVQVSTQVPGLHQRGQLALSRCFELTRVLAQLRRNERIVEPFVQLLLAARGEDFARLDLGDAVLGDREPTAHRVLAQREVVLLRAGEVLEQVPV